MVVKIKKAVFIFKWFYPYSDGVGNVTYGYAKSLIRTGWEVHVICDRMKKTDLEYEEHNKIKIHRIIPNRNILGSLKLGLIRLSFKLPNIISKIKQISPDIVVGMMLANGVISALATKKLGIRSMTNIQGEINEVYGFLRPVLYKYALKNNTLITATNNDFINLSKRFTDKKIYLLPNVLDENTLPIKEFNAKVDKSKFNLLSVGRLVVVNGIETKGISYVLEAIKSLPNCLLHIAGDGSLLKDFKKYVKDNNIEERVIFHGKIERGNLMYLMKQCDALVFPSLYEGLSMTVIEAMCFGLPVVTTCLGGQRDYIKNKVNGVFVEKASSKSIFDAVSFLKNNPSKTKQIAKQGRKTYEEHFTLNAFSEKFEKLLKLKGVIN